MELAYDIFIQLQSKRRGALVRAGEKSAHAYVGSGRKPEESDDQDTGYDALGWRAAREVTGGSG